MRRSRARRLLAALSLLCLLGISPGYAQGPVPQTAAQAMAIARRHVARYSDRIAAWRTAAVADPTPYYDLEGQVAAYVVPVVDRGRDIGHVVVSSQALPNPVLAFSAAPAPHRAAREAIRAQADSLGLTVHERVPLYLGPLSYFYPAGQGTAMSLLEMGRGRRVDLDPAVADRLARAVRTIEGTPASPPVEDSAALPASSLGATALKRLYGPDYLWYVGCGPTAAGNLMGYWADRGYPALVLGGSDGDYTGTIERLGQLMGTNEAGWTWLPIDDDLQDFAQERGYAFRTSERSSPPYSAYVAEIDAHRPLVVLVNGHELYGNHFITGFGYEYEPGNDTYRYMIVHDTWWSTAEDYWIQYGAGYSAIWFDTVVPPAVEVDTIPPSSSVAPLPPFQTTPSFSVHWSGTDIGWG
ncbi:MAG: C39 family peptidase, partial [Anaerolineae bacterium]